MPGTAWFGPWSVVFVFFIDVGPMGVSNPRLRQSSDMEWRPNGDRNWIRISQVCLAWIVGPQEAFGALVEDVWTQSPDISIGKYATTVVMVAAGIPHKGQDLQFQRQRSSYSKKNGGYSNKNAQGHDTLDIPQ